MDEEYHERFMFEIGLFSLSSLDFPSYVLNRQHLAHTFLLVTYQSV